MAEKMADFFDLRSGGYEEHMKANIKDFNGFYNCVADQFPKTDNTLKILDLGVGTGLEIDKILPKVPNAQFLLIDLSELMLAKLKEKFPGKERQLVLVNESYLQFDFPITTFDYVVSVQSLHHLLFHEKLDVYTNIRKSLKPNGKFIEADFIVSDDLEKEYLKNFLQHREQIEKMKPGEYHIDIPFSIQTTNLCLEKAGFSKSEIKYRNEYAAVIVSTR